MNKNGLVYTIVFSFGITFILVFLLALANESTIEIVEQNERVNEYSAVLNALGIDFDPRSPQDIIAKYGEIERVALDDGSLYYRAQVGGQNLIALPYRGAGIWGTIEIVIGMKADLTRFTGLTIVSHSETPGLGARIEESWFTDQFVNQRIPETGSIDFVRGAGTGDTDKDNTQVDAITGATGTSNSMRRIIASGLDKIRGIVGGNS